MTSDKLGWDMSYLPYSDHGLLTDRGYSLIQSYPMASRNIPPVAEAVQWARELLKRVEKPMEVFKNHSIIMQSMVK